MRTPTAINARAPRRSRRFELVRAPSQANGNVAMMSPAAYAACVQPVCESDRVSQCDRHAGNTIFSHTGESGYILVAQLGQASRQSRTVERKEADVCE